MPRRLCLALYGWLLVFAAFVAHGCTDPSQMHPARLVEEGAGSADFSYRLALRYLNGEGVDRDEQRALTLLTRAADADHPGAQLMLADIFASGRGVAREPAWATMWYGRAAALGHAEAQYRLALAHANGIGTGISYIDAYKWATIAASSGSAEAARLRKTLQGRMIREEVEPAAKAAAHWRPTGEKAEPDEPLIRFVQFALHQSGYDSGSIDGILGPRTLRAIKAATRRQPIRTDHITPALVEWLRARLRTVQRAGHV